MENTSPPIMNTQNAALKPTQPAARLEPSIDRKVLGQISPNRQINTITALAEKERSSDKLLKRSYVGSLHNDQGLKYLKRRRMSPPAFEANTGGPAAPLSIDDNQYRPEVDMFQSIEKDEALQYQGSSQHQSDRESSAERHSFSSLINYDPSSQSRPVLHDESPHALHGPESATKPTIASNRPVNAAETLRLRLQMAMYKVKTNQIEVPFDYLREETSTGSRESDKAVAEAVEQLRREAQDRLRRHDSSGKAHDNHASESTKGQSLLEDTRLSATKTSVSNTMVGDPSPKKTEIAVGLLGLKNSI